MDKTRLLNHSDKTRKQARKLLDSTNLIYLLSRYGDVHLIGSYPLNIMYGPDVDIVIEAKDIRKNSVDALKDIVDRKLFRKIEYGDFVNFPMDKRPEGYILVLKAVVEGVKWEVEVWFLEDASDQITYNKELRSKLTKENRIKILEAKYQRATSKTSKHQLSSYEIYEQILGHTTS